MGRGGMIGGTRDRPARAAGTATDRARLVGCGLAGAIVVAPFLALVVGLSAGLAVMLLALGATALLAAEAGRGAAAPVRRWLLVTAVANGVLALACGVVLVVRLI